MTVLIPIIIPNWVPVAIFILLKTVTKILTVEFLHRDYFDPECGWTVNIKNPVEETITWECKIQKASWGNRFISVTGAWIPGPVLLWPACFLSLHGIVTNLCKKICMNSFEILNICLPYLKSRKGFTVLMEIKILSFFKKMLHILNFHCCANVNECVNVENIFFFRSMNFNINAVTTDLCLSLSLSTERGLHFLQTSSYWGGVKMSITSDEVNFLVYRYLQESGNFLL